MPITITIVRHDDGRIDVEGPLDNKAAFYGLLEVAKDVCRDYHAEKERRVKPALPGELAGLRSDH